MIEFTGFLEVDRPPNEVFEQLADMAELHRWNPNVRSSSRLIGDRFAPGSTYVSTIARGPIRITARSVLVSVDPGRAVRYEGSIGGLWSIDSLTFLPAGAGTRVTFHNQTRVAWWLRPFSPLLNAAFQAQAGRAVDGARRFLASTIVMPTPAS